MSVTFFLGIWGVWIAANITRFMLGTFSIDSLTMSTLFCFVLSLPFMLSTYIHEVHKIRKVTNKEEEKALSGK